MQTRREAALRAIDAELKHRSSLNDTRAGIKEHGRILKGLDNIQDSSGPKQIAAARLLNSQAAAWNDLDGKAQNAPSAFRAAKAALLDNARDFGLSEAAAKR